VLPSWFTAKGSCVAVDVAAFIAYAFKPSFSSQSATCCIGGPVPITGNHQSRELSNSPQGLVAVRFSARKMSKWVRSVVLGSPAACRLLPRKRRNRRPAKTVETCQLRLYVPPSCNPIQSPAGRLKSPGRIMQTKPLSAFLPGYPQYWGETRTHVPSGR